MLIFAKYARTKLMIMEQNEKEKEILRLMQGMDINEVMSLVMKHGNRYSRRILTCCRGLGSNYFRIITFRLHTGIEYLHRQELG